MEKRQVLHVCHSYDPPYLDVARQYCALFPRDQWRITTVFLTGAADPGIATAIGSDEVVFFEYPSSALRGLKLSAIKRMRQLVKERNFSFSIAHRYKALYICTHIPGLFTFGVHHRPGGYKRWTRRWYVRRKREQLALLGVSNDVRDNMRRSLPDFEPERIETLYNRVDPEALRDELFSRAEAREKLGLPASAWLFANVGRLHPDKDQATLIKAFARVADKLSDSLLVIIGKGRLETELKTLAEQLGVADRVVFTGPVKDARRYFRAFDGFVLSSDREPFGMVLLEAMVAELPIIATNCGGAPEVVGDSGLLFEFGGVEALAQRMQELHGLDGDRRKALCESMQSRLMRHFSDDAVRKVFWSLPMMTKIGVGQNASALARSTV